LGRGGEKGKRLSFSIVIGVGVGSKVKAGKEDVDGK
jgi:hypothetical protein